MKPVPTIRFRIDFAESAHVGPGKISLLEAIKVRGSVSAAGRALGLSYRRAWTLLESMNTSFDVPVSVNTVGGIRGGGAIVTQFGDLLIERYREVERQCLKVGQEGLREISSHVHPQPLTKTRKLPLAKRRKKKLV